jgi:hypothetical protein
MKLPTRQMVRLSEVPNMVRVLIDFSACGNTLVGYTDKDGGYTVKSYGNIIAYYYEGEAFYGEATYDSDHGRLTYIKQGFDLLARKTQKVSA